MLSSKQQQTIENSIWVVNTALKRQGLSNDEDLKQSAILYMCHCLERFEPNREIKWTTYAYKNIFLFIKRMHIKEKMISNRNIDEDFMELDLPDGAEDICKHNETVVLLDGILEICTADERKLLELKRQGYNHEEISTILHCSVSKINNQMQNIRAKVKDLEILEK